MRDTCPNKENLQKIEGDMSEKRISETDKTHV
jgi:hypothetical protein